MAFSDRRCFQFIDRNHLVALFQNGIVVAQRTWFRLKRIARVGDEDQRSFEASYLDAIRHHLIEPAAREVDRVLAPQVHVDVNHFDQFANAIGMKRIRNIIREEIAVVAIEGTKTKSASDFNVLIS